MTTKKPHSAIDVMVSRQKRFKVQTSLIKKISAKICDLLGLGAWELSVRFVGKEEIAELNKTYRNKDYATDVLSFPQMEWERPLKVNPKKPVDDISGFGNTLGDIVICLDVAEENAGKIGQGVDREVCFLLVHGLLHLCGHDHEVEEEERVMLEEQRKIMDFLSEPLPLWKDCVRNIENV